METKCNCLALRQANRKVTQFYDLAFAKIGLRVTQFQILDAVRNAGPVTMSALADAMVMDRATLGHNIRPLEARGLIQMKIGEDRRSREISLTEEGLHLTVEGLKVREQAQVRFEDALGGEVAAALRSLLHRVATVDFKLP